MGFLLLIAGIINTVWSIKNRNKFGKHSEIIIWASLVLLILGGSTLITESYQPTLFYGVVVVLIFAALFGMQILSMQVLKLVLTSKSRN